MPQISYDLLDALEEGPQEHEGLKIKCIDMHGRIVGIGVEVMELSWTHDLDEENIFDVNKIAEARVLVPRLKEIFDHIGLLGLEEKVVIRHHIDLGG